MEEEEEEEGLVEVEEEEGEEVASVVDLVSLSLLTEKMYSLKIGWIKKNFYCPHSATIQRMLSVLWVCSCR